MDLTVIFPAFNEEASLAPAIRKSVHSVRKIFSDFEVIIVDDASRDRTGAIADDLSKEFPEVRVIHHEKNQGAGASFFTGLYAARGDLIVHNGVDMPFDPDDLPLLLRELEHADVVVAARKSRAGYSAFRIVTSVVNVTLLNLLFGLRLHDYNFVQLFRREVVQSIRVGTKSTAFITPEMIIRAHDKGFRVVEVQIAYHERKKGEATSGSAKVIYTSMRDMFRFWVQRNRGSNDSN